MRALIAIVTVAVDDVIIVVVISIFIFCYVLLFCTEINKLNFSVLHSTCRPIGLNFNDIYFQSFFFLLEFLSLLYGLWWKFSITIFSCNINDLPFAHTIRLFIYLLTLPTLILLLLATDDDGDCFVLLVFAVAVAFALFFPRQLDYYQINLMCTHFRD